MLSEYVLIKIPPDKIAMFRFLLEAFDNVALFSVLQRKTALIKVFYSPDQKNYATSILACIASEIELEIINAQSF